MDLYRHISARECSLIEILKNTLQTIGKCGENIENIEYQDKIII